jgi:hypothetical protein
MCGQIKLHTRSSSSQERSDIMDVSPTELDDSDEIETPTVRSKNIPWKPIAIGIGLVIVGLLIGYIWRGHVDDPAIVVVNGDVTDSRTFAHLCEVSGGLPVLKSIISDSLTLQQASSDGVLPSDSDVDARYDKVSQQAGFADQLTNTAQTPDDIKHKLLVGMAQQNIITKGITVSPEEVQGFYDQNIDPRNPNARYAQPDRVQIAVIVTADMADHEAALHALASGASFSTVAQQYSKDSSAHSGGVLPAIRRNTINRARYPGLEDIVFALTPGQQVDTYQNGKTFWTIRCVARQNAFNKPFSQVADECNLGAELAKGLQLNGAQLQSDAQSFQQSAKITEYWPAYKVVTLNP